jgi:SAM-dependent methyltransferase
MTSDHEYLLANQQPGASGRLAALARVFDPVTFSHLDAIGVASGWKCWEVGAGLQSVPAWLESRVGPRGRVLATDLDPSLLRSTDVIEVRRHDVGSDPAPADDFDLVHARLVLVHVANRAAALAAMVDALRPGGWLLVEDADPQLQPLACPDETSDAERLANRIRTGFRDLMAERGVDLAFGRTLPRLLRDSGLIDVQADGYFPLTSRAGLDLEVATVVQLRDRLESNGSANREELDRHLTDLTEGRIEVTTAPSISAWGRRPE